jgi:cytoskeletal protein RodZ
VLDLDEFLRQYAEAVNMPARTLRSAIDVQRIDQQHQAQASVQQAWAKGQAAVQGLEGLSRTQVGGGQNAIAALLGNSPPNESP